MSLSQRKPTEIISIILDSDDELDENPASSERSTAETQSSSTAKEPNNADGIETVSTSGEINNEDDIMLIEPDDAQSITETIENVEAVASSTMINRDDNADGIETVSTSSGINNEDDLVLIEPDDDQSIIETIENVEAVASSTMINRDENADGIKTVSTSSGINNEDDIMLIGPDDAQSIIETIENVEAVASSTIINRDEENEPSTSSASHNDLNDIDNDLVLIEFDIEETSNENVTKETASSSTQTTGDEIDRDKPGPSGISSSVLNNRAMEDVVIAQSPQEIRVLDTQNNESNSNGNDNDDDIMIVDDDNDSIPKDSITSIIDQEDNNINIQCNVTTCDRGTNTDRVEGSGTFENVKYDPEDDLIFVKPIVEDMRYKSVDGNMYICLVCKRLYDNIALMMSHLKIHDEKSRLCYRCGLMFHSFPDTLKHMKLCIPEKKFNTPLRRCSICKFRTTTHSAMRDHLYYVHGNKRFICNICNTSFYNPDHLRTHVQVEHRNYYKCNICNLEMMFYNFDSHMRIHLLDTINHNTPKCSFCNEQLPFSDSDVKQHFQSRNHNVNETLWKIRNQITEFTCLCCFTPVKFTRFYDYSLHLKTHGYYKMNMDEVISACLSLQKTNRLPFPKKHYIKSSQTTNTTSSFRKNRVIRDGKLPCQVKTEMLVPEDLAASSKTIKTEDSMVSSEYELKTDYSSTEGRSSSFSEYHTFVDDIKTECIDDEDDVSIVINDDDCKSSNIKLEVN